MTGSPLEGSADLIGTLVCSIPAMPRASMAHIAYALAPPVVWIVCGVAVAENGWAALIRPAWSRQRESPSASSASTCLASKGLAASSGKPCSGAWPVAAKERSTA